MFVGRQAELKTLEKLYLSDDFEFAVVYGRRRVGKSSLLNEFSHYKDNVIFFSGKLYDLSLQSRKLLDNVLIADYRMSETYIFSYSKDDHKYYQHKDRRNDNDSQYRKDPAQSSELYGVILKDPYVFFYVEDLLQSVPETFEHSRKASQHFGYENKKPF